MNILIHRPGRITTPIAPAKVEELAPPPTSGDGGRGGVPLQMLIPVIGAALSMTVMTLLRGNKIFMVIGVVILVVAITSGLVMMFTQRGNQVRQRQQARENYLDYLERLRGRLRREAIADRRTALSNDPHPQSLPEVARTPDRLWERRRSDADLLKLRVGLGTLPRRILQLPEEQNPVEPYDQIMAAEARQVIAQYSSASGVPITVDLDAAGHVSLIGDREATTALARSLLAQLATFHAPDDVEVALAFPSERAAAWRHVDLLPHVSATDVYDGPVPARRVAPTLRALRNVLGANLTDRVQSAAVARRTVGSGEIDPPRLIVILDEWGQIAQPFPLLDAELSLADLKITVIHLLSDRLHEPSDVATRITIDNDIVTVDDLASPALTASPDVISDEVFETLARMLSPRRLSLTRREEAETSREFSIGELLEVGDISTLDTKTTWQERSARDFLRVPFGVDDQGNPVLLDIKESAQLGMGPHGICIGATGSGKSEFLRTLVFALAAAHHPDDLSMILVDFKGGAAFAPYEELPHVAGLIDNLSEDPQLIERARASIQGEIVRRQRMLKDAGNVASISHYRELRRDQPDMDPLPHLFLVIDEFGELLTAEPEFIDLFLTIGRIGRALGIHLLLASQRIEAGKLRGLETYLSYRIGLRTFSASESSMILDTPDAFHLPAVPGYGYLKVDTTVYTRFRAGYVSGPAPTAEELAPPEDKSSGPKVRTLPLYNGLAERTNDESPEDVLKRPDTGRNFVDIGVDRLRQAADQVDPVWLPPLPDRLTLATVLGQHGEGRAALRIPIGLLDEPKKQRQNPWYLDLTRGGGHLAIFGAPKSGRSTFLRTVAASLALTHSPQEIAVYGFDFGGGALGLLEGLPHVGGIAPRTNREKLSRVSDELRKMLDERERVFSKYGIDNITDFRRRHQAGEISEIESADVVVLIDEAGALRNDFDDIDTAVRELLQRGGQYGMHVVLGLTRWNDVRANLQPLIGTRIELHLNDVIDSQVGRKLAETLRDDQPGRAITDDKKFGQIALPYLDDTQAGQGNPLERVILVAKDRWAGLGASRIRLLPESFSPVDLPDEIDEPDVIPFGLRQDTMSAEFLDPHDLDPHLIVFGDKGSGRSSLLRVLAEGFVARWDSESLVFAVIDPRGKLRHTIPEEYLGGHATSAAEAYMLCNSVAQEFERRQREGVGNSARVVVLVDDYDIIAAARNDALKSLMPYFSAARDLRLTIVLARPVAGAARALYDVTLQSLRDSGGTMLIMSGERSEGQITPGVYAERMAPGRGRLIRRGDMPTIVQVANPDHVTSSQES